MSTQSDPSDDEEDRDGFTQEDRARMQRLAEYFEDEDPEFAELNRRLAQSIEVSNS